MCLKFGKPSVTHYRVLKHEKNNISSVELQPVTGRSHQLRLHMKSIGHPIIGDPLYADETTFSASNRLNLHSFSLEIVHPKTKKLQVFSSEAPF